MYQTLWNYISDWAKRMGIKDGCIIIPKDDLPLELFVSVCEIESRVKNNGVRAINLTFKHGSRIVIEDWGQVLALPVYITPKLNGNGLYTEIEIEVAPHVYTPHDDDRPTINRLFGRYYEPLNVTLQLPEPLLVRTVVCPHCTYTFTETFFVSQVRRLIERSGCQC